jgi:signal transduction histidine kinase
MAAVHLDELRQEGKEEQRSLRVEEIDDEAVTEQTRVSIAPQCGIDVGGLDAVVCADRDMFRQVLVNLCSNSALAIDGSGSITFTIARNALEVTDTGGGIAESLRERVFDPYVTTRRSGDAMGLGLSISRKIMLDHGGELQLLSTGPAGTTFRLTFGASECN